MELPSSYLLTGNDTSDSEASLLANNLKHNTNQTHFCVVAGIEGPKSQIEGYIFNIPDRQICSSKLVWLDVEGAGAGPG